MARDPAMTDASIETVVAADLCIGCGLCEAVTGGAAPMTLTDRGSLRPASTGAFTADEHAALVHACPGIVAPRQSATADQQSDDVWGAYHSMVMAWAADPEVRFTASTGGVLSALGQHLLTTGAVAAILHVGPDPAAPTRSRWVVSETPDQVLANAGSRYGPAAPLAGLVTMLERGEPFAVIAKPCDLGALHRFAQIDPRVDELCVTRLAMVCGGQSRLTKTLELMAEFGLDEEDVASLRYRGFGNPGPTRIVDKTGATYEQTYQQLWEDASTWAVETRCKVCPDALGECADIAAADAWPGGSPVGEDDGFNAVAVRTPVGARLMDDAAAAGALVVGAALTPDDLSEFQPHQVRKKVALAARLAGMLDAGVRPIAASGLRIDSLGERLDSTKWAAERQGSRRRFEAILATTSSADDHSAHDRGADDRSAHDRSTCDHDADSERGSP